MENNKDNTPHTNNNYSVRHRRRGECFVGSEEDPREQIERLEKLYQDLTANNNASSTSSTSLASGGQDKSQTLSLSLSFEQVQWIQTFRDVVERIFDLPQQREDQQQQQQKQKQKERNRTNNIRVQFHEIRIDGSGTNTEQQHDYYPRRFPPFTNKIVLYRVVFPPYHRLTFPRHLQKLELNGLVIDTTITSSLQMTMMMCELDLTDSRIVDIDNLVGWLGRNKSLTKISFDECNLMDEPLSRLIRSLHDHPTLECLVVDNNKCRSRSVDAIAGVLRSPTCVIRHLSMANVAFGSMQEINIRPILTALRQQQHLHHQTRRLRILDIGMNNLDDTIMEDVVQMLRSPNSSSLEELKLYGNKFTNNGIQMFANHLHEYKSLRCLDIEGLSMIDDEEAAMKMLRDGLKDGKNQTLVDIAHDITSPAPPLPSQKGRRCRPTTAEVLNYHLDLNWGRCRQVLDHDDKEKKDKRNGADAVGTATTITATGDIKTKNENDKKKQKQEREFPVSLWPYILHRANKGPKIAVEDDDDSSVSSSDCTGQSSTAATTTTLTRRPVASDIIKYFIQNGSSSFSTYREE